MKRIMVLCCLLACVCFAVASQAEKQADVLQDPFVTLEATDVDASVISTDDQDAANRQRSEEKTIYYALVDKLFAGTASISEMADIDRLAAIYMLPNVADLMAVPEVEEPARDGSLDQGSSDTLSNCASATVIPGCPYSDSGLFDGDNDCSVVSASPSNEVFYTFTPSVTGAYTFRLRSGSGGAAALRVMSGACCAGAASSAFSSSSVSTECPNPLGGNEPATVVTYLRDTLTAGVQYWIHAGTSSATVSSAAYDFQMYCVPCPTEESATAHGTCETAQAIACNDSILGDSAFAPNFDWYTFTVSAPGADVTIFVGARELGHCLSGNYPSNTSSPLGAVDGRHTLFDGCGGTVDSIGFDDDGTPAAFSCQFDSRRTYSLAAGTYYIKVWNYGVQAYILKVNCTPFPDCPVEYPVCDTPSETEPNNICPTQLDPDTLRCEETLFGSHCPSGDRDLFVTVIPPLTRMSITLYDGVGCATTPATCARMDAKNSTTCANLLTGVAGTIFATNSGLTDFVIIIDVYGLGACLTPYKLVTTCCELEDQCAEPYILPETFLFVDTVNTCCLLNVVPCIRSSNCSGTCFTSSQDAIYQFTLQSTAIVNFSVLGPLNADEQILLTLNCAVDPESLNCVNSRDVGGADAIPESFTDTLAAGTYYVVISYFSTGCGDLILTIGSDQPLDVELLDFSAIAGDRQVNLTWNTGSESNNDRFEVIRDGAKVTEVDAVNSATGSSYSWTDNSVSNGVTYNYSLVSVDVNGAREELGTVSATPNFGAATVTEYALHQNYPNPFNPSTSITFDMVEAGFVNLSVYNLLGQEVATVANGTFNAGRHTVNFDATGLSSGLYLYKIEANGFSAQKKLLLMK